MAIGRKTMGAILGLTDTGTGSRSAAVTRSCRTSRTASMTTTVEVLLAASNEAETKALTRVEISAGAILGRIKTRIRPAALTTKTRAGIATFQTDKITAKETVTQTDSEAASQPIGKQLSDQRRAGRAD